MVAPITVTPIIPLGPDTIINGDPYQIAGRPTPQPVSSPVAPVGSMGLGGYTPQQSANVSNLLRAALPVQQSAPALPTMPASSLMGLFQNRNPLAQGLLAAGKALTDYGAPSTMPKGGFMGALGAGGQGFIEGMQSAQDANLKNRIAASKLAMDMRSAGQVVGSAETGFSYLNPVTGTLQPLMRGTGGKNTTLYKNLVAAGYTPGTPEFTDAMRRQLNKPPMKIDMTNDPLASARALGYESAIEYAIEKANSSAAIIPSLQQAQSLFDSGVPTGKLSEMTMPIRQLFNSLMGGDYNETLTLQEAMQSLSNKAALQQHGPGMGPMTDADFVRYRAIAPSLANTPAGNRLIIQRLMHEAQGDQLYKREIMRQMESNEPVDELKAWQKVQEQLGPLIPNVQTEMSLQDWSKTDEALGYVGKVIMLNGKAQYVGN